LSEDVIQRELAHHEALYSGAAQQIFATPAVRALRAHMARRILAATGAGPSSRVLSLGCGIGDTELLLAPHVGSITGIDLSPAAIRQARADAQAAGLDNVEFLEGNLNEIALETRGFDAVVAVFFLHHLPDAELDAFPARLRGWLKPRGVFYGLDPNRYRLSGALGSLLVPGLMRKYQTPDERQLKPRETAARFAGAGFEARTEFYDFLSTPFAGLFQHWRGGYRAARAIDRILIRTPFLRALGSNFEVIARA
jgi:cyclopropane fatty-acyl-phospholipid synthase-like methyltransferase